MNEALNQQLVRICPLCGKHNPPDETFCACGASLADVDFTHLGSMPKPSPQDEIANLKSAAALVICPHADCAQPNPAGSERCVYCNRPLAQPASEAVDEKQSVLPPSMRAKFQVLEIMPTAGGQADLVLAETTQHEKRVIKLYRKGIQPDWEVLKRLSAQPAPNLVKFFAYGEADGVAYEVMEYCEPGSLRNLLEDGPQSAETIRRLIAQMSALLSTLHAQHILHRDIKPENILLRSHSPLEIALTDFGAASLKMATQYFTAGARTAHYAAPEVLTGVLDEKSDWWSFGMVLLEAVTGRHPYANLSEQVALHQLATQVVDVKSVYDDALRVLCRGLLLRNPNKRWGANEVARWLAGDASLAMPEENGAGTVVRPYTLVRSQCVSRTDLALALARQWEDGKKDLMRGVIINWVEHELRDFNLARDIHDVMLRRDLTEDARLLRVIVSALPGIPPIWKGKVITREALAHAATQAVNDHRDALDWLLSMYKEDVLGILGERGNADMTRIAAEWKQAVDGYRLQWERARELEEEWRKRPRAHAREVADIDHLMYLAPIRMNVPSLNRILPDVVLALYVPAYAATARQAVRQAQVTMGENCGWYEKFVEETHDQGNLFWPVAQRLITFAAEDAEHDRKVQQQVVRNDEQPVAGVIEKIGVQCKRLVDLGELDELGEYELEQARRAVEDWLALSAWVKGLDHKNAGLHELSGKLDNVTKRAMHAQLPLDAHEYQLSVMAIWLKPVRLLLLLMIVAGVASYSLAAGVLLGLAAAGALAWRWHQVRQSQDELANKLNWLVVAAREFQGLLQSRAKAQA